MDVFDRHTTQSLDDRSLLEIIETLGPVIDLLEKDPLHITWMETMASYYVQGCVNQPF